MMRQGRYLKKNKLLEPFKQEKILYTSDATADDINSVYADIDEYIFRFGFSKVNTEKGESK